MDEYREPHTRTVIWYNPAPALQALRTMSGIAHLKARITDATGELYAHGTSTCLLLQQ